MSNNVRMLCVLVSEMYFANPDTALWNFCTRGHHGDHDRYLSWINTQHHSTWPDKYKRLRMQRCTHHQSEKIMWNIIRTVTWLFGYTERAEHLKLSWNVFIYCDKIGLFLFLFQKNLQTKTLHIVLYNF